MSDEQAFRAAIAAAPEDQAPRLIYADWLDEHDRPAEAERHRRWAADLPAALAWLRAFAQGHETCDNYADDYWAEREGRDPLPEVYRPVTFEEVLQAGSDYADHEDYFVQRGDESLRSAMNGQTSAMYWRYWSAVTGRELPAGHPSYGLGPAPFSCNC